VNLRFSKQINRGFTIVELLIVIVVIAILAAITIVAYNGIQNRAHDTAVQSDLAQFHRKNQTEKLTRSDDGFLYAGDFAGYRVKFNKSAYDLSLNNLMYCRSNDGQEYGLAAVSKSGKAYYVNTAGAVRDYTWSWTSAAASTCTNVINSSEYAPSWGNHNAGMGWVHTL